jgi:hypothetical protein
MWAAAHHGLVRARGAYRAVRRAKQAAHQQQQLLESYFGQRQRDFWRVFAGERPALTPAADARRWTAWFEQLLGQPTAPVQLDAQDALLQRQLFARLRTCGQAEAAALNAPLSVEEVAAAMQLPRGKAADLQGLTGEALRAAAVADAVRPGGIMCGAFVECVRWLLQRVFDGDALPAPMRVSKLVPVPKPGQAASPRDMHLYRGICVSSMLSRVWDRVLFRRLNSLAEQQGLRTPTQCGFRPGHGTLDAVYTLQHVCDSYRAQRRLVYAVFVDFTKAFDLVDRGLLLERCRALGISGACMRALEALYQRVLLRVAVGGQAGREFASHVGTKQGSVLSPLLFGWFIEVLHELVRQHAGAVGPVLAGLRVPLVIYADDVLLLAESEADA